MCLFQLFQATRRVRRPRRFDQLRAGRPKLTTPAQPVDSRHVLLCDGGDIGGPHSVVAGVGSVPEVVRWRSFASHSAFQRSRTVDKIQALLQCTILDRKSVV